MKLGKSLIMTLLMALLMTLFSISAFADEPDVSHDTDVEIGFQASTGIVPPVNPEEPDTESGETGTNQPGPLSLDWVPQLQFGTSHAVSPMVQSYNTITTQPYIQVSDLRGTGSGWTVTASLSRFRSNSVDTLPGAYITLKNGRVNTATVGIEPPVPNDPIVLTSDDETVGIASAAGALQAGRGTWVVRWYPIGGAQDVQLTVPAAAAAVGTHSAVITWIISDAP